MGGPQVATAIEVSRALRARSARPAHHLGRVFSDAVSRGRAQQRLRGLRHSWAGRGHVRGSARRAWRAAIALRLRAIHGLSWRQRRGRHEQPRPGLYARAHRAGAALRQTCRPKRIPREDLSRPAHGRPPGGAGLPVPLHVLRSGGDVRGRTALPPAERLDRDLAVLKHQIGADSVQFYDHNFFDREEEMVPLLEVLARHEMPWWCYARSDALVNLSADIMAAGSQEPPAHGLHRSRNPERPAPQVDTQGNARRTRRWKWRRCVAATA